jgi:hypothetical protein
MTLFRLASRISGATALAVVALLTCARPACSAGYPRLGLYGQIGGNGYPLWDATGALDNAALDDIARYDEVVFDASPITEYRPDALAALRQRHPGIKLLAYVTGHNIWYAAAPDSNVHYPTRYWRTVRDLDGFLYNQLGNQYGLTNLAFANVNLAKRDGSGRYVVAEALAQLFYDAIVSKGTWDGLFIDTYCSSISWSQTPTEQIDYVRAGYATIQDFDAAWQAGTDALAVKLRQLSGSTEILVGNCLAGSKYAWFNGWMVENFPFQNGGTWDENMYRDPGGYFASEKGYLSPRYNHIFTAAGGLTTPYDADNTRRVRLGLGSASLGEGFGVFGFSGRVTSTYPYHRWWYDEYAVDRATGRSTTLLKDTGWLGQPLGAYSQVIWITGAPDAITNSGFESDLSGWRFGSTYPGTFTQDASNPGQGSLSGKVSLTQIDVVPWGAGLQSIGSIPMTVGQYYSATFRARASAPRRMTVVAGAPGGGELAHGYAFLTTAWKQFQIVFQPLASGTSNLQFHLGDAAGDVWFDDVHFQPGTSSIYRRDFQHGVVLVNPTTLDLTVPLERNFYKIRGLADPVTNDGSSGQQFVVKARDALFLLGTDQAKPAAVLDLHIAR